MSVRFDFSGRTVLVTGAARGIGYGLASLFGEAGATVAMADLNEEQLAAATTGSLADAVPLVCDVSNSASVQAAVDDLVGRTGRIDAVVNNAGILRDKVLWKLSDDDWAAVIGVHLTGTFNVTRAVTPVMREAGYGRIVNVTSYTGLHGNTGQANYAAAKAGIIGFTRTAAKELARFGITVNAISPNAETAMVASIPADKKAELAAAIPMGRFAEPDEMAPAVGFLCSEQAGYVTGIVMPVDGGLSI